MGRRRNTQLTLAALGLAALVIAAIRTVPAQPWWPGWTKVGAWSVTWWPVFVAVIVAVTMIIIQRWPHRCNGKPSPQWTRRPDGTGWIRSAPEAVGLEAKGFDWSKLTSAVTALTALAALTFTAQSLAATRDQIDVAEQGQITNRYTTAVDQISTPGADHLETRLGGIYALERLAADSPRDQPTIIEVLSAFVRSNAPISATKNNEVCEPVALDVQAALTVLGRRNPAHDADASIDFSKSCLTNANLTGANLIRADLNNTNLSGAKLLNTKLNNANLSGANLSFAIGSGADLTNAELYGANLTDVLLDCDGLTESNPACANLTRADLNSADLTNADLDGANLTEAFFTCNRATEANPTCANLTNANLTEANLGYASLPEANLTNARLVGADLTSANLTRANLTGADLACYQLGARTEPTCTNLTKVRLVGANLTNANVEGANLTKALLDCDDLTDPWPNVTCANLNGANLMRANLTGADLTGADLYGANLTKVIGLDGH